MKRTILAMAFVMVIPTAALGEKDDPTQKIQPVQKKVEPVQKDVKPLPTATQKATQKGKSCRKCGRRHEKMFKLRNLFKRRHHRRAH